MKKVIIIFMLLFILQNRTYALDTNSIIEEQIDEINLQEIEKEINKNSEKKINVKNEIKKFSLGENEFDIKKIITDFLNNFLKEIKNNFSLMGYIIVISIFSGLIKVLTDSFKDKSISEIANFVIYIVIIGIVLTSLNDIKNIYVSIVERSTNVMKVSLPILTTMLIASGKIKTAALFEPITFFIINGITFLLIKVIGPIITTLSTIVIINYISNRNLLSELIDGLKTLIKSTLKIIVGFVLSMTYISKITTGVFDGTFLKVIESSISSFIPVVGTSIGNVSNVVVSSINLVKNSTGIVIIIGMITTIIGPVIKLVSIIIIYKLSIILIEQIADEKIKNCLKDISEIMSFILTCIIMIQLIYIIDITMIFST